MPLPRWLRTLLVTALGLLGVGMFAVAIADVGSGGTWLRFVVLLAIGTACAWGAVRVSRKPRSRAAVTGHLVLWETPMPGATTSDSPPLTIRGPRDAVERFIPLAEFDALFGGWVMWSAPAQPTSDLPGEALGVWSHRMCKRFRRLLRERGATIEVRREPGPAQQVKQFSKH